MRLLPLAIAVAVIVFLVMAVPSNCHYPLIKPSFFTLLVLLLARLLDTDHCRKQLLNVFWLVR